MFSNGPKLEVPIAAEPVTNRLPATLSKVPLNVKLTSPFNVPFPLAVITLISASFTIAMVDAVAAYDDVIALEEVVANEAVPVRLEEMLEAVIYDKVNVSVPGLK